MCEFCSFGPSTNKNNQDINNPDFAGFFSADAIEAAVRHAQKSGAFDKDKEVGDDDDDGT